MGSTTPYQFIKQGQLFIIPVGPAIDEVPYPTQTYNRAPDYSLWVHGKILEPALHADAARMSPSTYKEVRKDLTRYAPVEVSRSAFRRSQHAYVGVIDSQGKPYYFAFDSRGLSVREVDPNDDRVWKTFERLAEEEHMAAVRARRVEASDEMRQVDRELSEPRLVVTKGLREGVAEHIAKLYADEMARLSLEISEQSGDPPAGIDEEAIKAQLRYGKRADWRHDAPGSSWWRNVAVHKPKKEKQAKPPKATKPPKPTSEEKEQAHLHRYEARLRGKQAIRDKLRAERKQAPKAAKPKADDSRMNAWRQKHPGGNVDAVQAHPFAKGDCAPCAKKKRRVERTGPDAWRFGAAAKRIRVEKALPKKSKDDKVKKTPSRKASKKKAGAGGKTRYTYPNEKKGGGSKPSGQQQVPLVVTHDDTKHADPAEFATQLGVSVRTLQHTAKRLGRDGFVKFMRSHLKRFSAKHRLDPDYWGTLYERLQAAAVEPKI